MTTLKINYRLKDAAQREALKQSVMSYDHEGLIKKYCYENEVTETEAMNAFTELKKFLFICGVTSERLSPSVELDGIWHQFILFTKDYMDFCTGYFNRIIHHFPDTEFTAETKKANNVSYTRAYEIAEEEFGSLNPDYWINPNFLNAANCKDDGGNCNSSCSQK